RRGGEPAGARLLALARRELLEVLLPQLQGEARFRARLVAKALKIATHELEGGAAEEADWLPRLRDLAAASLPGGADLTAMSDSELLAAFSAGLRAGRLDGRQELYELLVKLTEERRMRVG
ncbi:MAG TPA: DUF6285 domain-containing protein, partial [Kiloniellaceae bacterium]